MRVAILGCGPAGLMAAHGVKRANPSAELTIYSNRVKSELYGAMYLHREIPDLGLPPEGHFNITILKAGDAAGYAEKVYGDRYHKVSFDQFESGNFPAWDLRRTYDILWDMYESRIRDQRVNGRFIEEMNDQPEGADIVFNTIPIDGLCVNRHHFVRQDIVILHGEDLGQLWDEYLMYYNGDFTVPWYRFSMFGKYKSWEFTPKWVDDALDTEKFRLSQGYKPISNNCDCFPWVHRLGRFGKWQKGVLTHHAYEEAFDAVLRS